ncbi:hypothetical protein ACF0H5_020155 [Mactra antiquata]
MMGSAGKLLLVTIGICVCLPLVQCEFYNVGVKYKINLNVFSGNSNPQWVIDQKSPVYQRLSWAVNRGPPTDLADALGYSGFVVEATNAFGQTAWKSVGRQTNRMLETLLLNSCPKSMGLKPAVINHVNSGIIGQYTKKPAPVGPTLSRHITITSNDDENVKITHRIFGRKKRQIGVCSTTFNPGAWNYGRVQRRNNCYNYATNLQTNTFAQPGRGSGRKYVGPENARNVLEATYRDGLTRLSGPRAGGQCVIVLVIWPGEDFHFYRLDSNGYWSHKSGRTPARDVDNSGNRILSPETADRGPYTIIAGYLGVGPSITIR